MTTVPKTKSSPGLSLALDYAPLLIFFGVNFLLPNTVAMRLVAANTNWLAGVDQLVAVILARVIVATSAFMIATVIAMVISLAKLGRISPMLWISGVLVLGFGGLTIYFHDERFIKMKPTFVYAAFAAVLAFGLATGRPLLGRLLGAAYPGLSELGWRKLTINWTAFFAGMAVLNEIVWRTSDAFLSKGVAWNTWVAFKFPGSVIITFIFALANIPMLMKHGLTLGDSDDVPVPPEG